MRTKTNIFCAAALIGALCAGFVACNEPKGPNQPEEPEVIGTAPVPDADVPEEVTAFFKKYLYPQSDTYPYVKLESEFNFGEIEFRDTECFVINSMEEFKAVAPPSAELPKIDFEKYTLIIGQHWMGNPGFTLEKQIVDTETEEMTLSLVYKPMEGASSEIMTVFYFWGLYPKLPERHLAVDVIVLSNN